ncbi:MAG: hypothetical protein HUU01_14305 [Saprospiraceae bacterium]|nr:hypothetical protein [Saprospiraceae bacterium]
MSNDNRLKQSKNIISTTIIILISIINLIAQSEEKIQVKSTKHQVGAEIEVELSFKNLTEKEIYISSDYHYGGYSKEDSVFIFDTEYYNSPADWLLMPNLKLEYKKLSSKEEWIVKQSKKSNHIRKIYVSFNFIEVGEAINHEVVRNLRNGFITTKQLYESDLEKNLEIVNLKLE